MNFLDALHTSSSGLSAQRTRINVISSNLANINTTRTPQGGPYRRKDVIFKSIIPQKSFSNMLSSQMRSGVTQVQVAGISNDPRPSLMKYDPEHPDADAKGYLALPNINMIEEMVNLISATRSYEAGVTAINASKSMVMKALEIGR